MHCNCLWKVFCTKWTKNPTSFREMQKLFFLQQYDVEKCVCFFFPFLYIFLSALSLPGINREEDDEEYAISLDQWRVTFQEPTKTDLDSGRLWEPKPNKILEYCFLSLCVVNKKQPNMSCFFSKLLMSSL